jgi:prepilin-type N-terminal cleavage/methylation domain-containing protein
MRQNTDDRGFTLIEMLIAIVILATVLLIVPLAGTRFSTSVSTDRIRNEANAVADAWVARCEAEPNYDSLATSSRCGTSGGTAVTTGSFNFTRTTTVVSDATLSGVADSLNDYKRVTVRVTGGGLTTPVARTVTIARP